MKLKVNGVEIPIHGEIVVDIEVEGRSEVVPHITLNISNGQLDVYRSQFTRNGNLKVHLIGDESPIF